MLPQTLTTIATVARTFLEPEWRKWQAERGYEPEVLSRWTCGRSSLFLKTMLREDFGLNAEWKSGTPRYIPDGPELGPFGFLTETGWESHAWVEVDGWIIDITADQFGAPPVLITANTDPRYGDGKHDTALPESKLRRQETIDALWPIWLGSALRTSVKAER